MKKIVMIVLMCVTCLKVLNAGEVNYKVINASSADCVKISGFVVRDELIVQFQGSGSYWSDGVPYELVKSTNTVSSGRVYNLGGSEMVLTFTDTGYIIEPSANQKEWGNGKYFVLPFSIGSCLAIMIHGFAAMVRVIRIGIFGNSGNHSLD